MLRGVYFVDDDSLIRFHGNPRFGKTTVFSGQLDTWTLVYGTKQGRIQDFKLGGGALKKIAPSGGRRENFGVFRVKNHDFTPKKSLFFFNFRGCAPPP